MKPPHRVGIPAIDPLRIGPRRIKVDSERPVQTRDESLRLLGLALGGDSTEHAYIPGVALGDEKVAIGRCANQPWIIESTGIQLDLKPQGHLRPRFLWTLHQLRTIARRRRRERQREVSQSNLAYLARFFIAEVG